VVWFECARTRCGACARKCVRVAAGQPVVRAGCIGKVRMASTYGPPLGNIPKQGTVVASFSSFSARNVTVPA
jgi:hypothetical protein